MNKRKIIASLNKIANELDNNGLYNEANTITKVMSELAYYPPEDPPDDYYGTDEEDKCPECESDNLMFDNEGELLMCNDCGWDVNDSGHFRSHDEEDRPDDPTHDPEPLYFPGLYKD